MAMQSPCHQEQLEIAAASCLHQGSGGRILSDQTSALIGLSVTLGRQFRWSKSEMGSFSDLRPLRSGPAWTAYPARCKICGPSPVQIGSAGWPQRTGSRSAGASGRAELHRSFRPSAVVLQDAPRRQSMTLRSKAQQAGGVSREDLRLVCIGQPRLMHPLHAGGVGHVGPVDRKHDAIDADFLDAAQ